MGHRYEVTEHTGEASGEVETVEAVASMESGFVPSQGMTFRSQPPPPPRPRHRSSSSTTTTTTSTTTEAPNYPASFLKKFREREASTTTRRPRKHHHHNKEIYVLREDEDNSVGSTTPPSFAMSSLRARLQDQQRHHRQQHKQQQEEEDDLESALVDAMHGEKWPSEVAHSGFQLSSPIGPSAVAFEQPLAKAPRGQYKRQTRDSIRQRGTVKFADKPNYDEA